MDYVKYGTGAFWRASSALFAGGFFTFAVLYSTQPLLPVFSQQFHITPAVSSLALSLTTGTLSVFLLIAALLSERWGRKRIMGISLFLSAIIAILTAFSPDFLSLIILRTLQGVVLAGLPSIAMAYIGEEIHPDSLGTAMGLYVSGTTVGGMFGRIVTGMITDFFSWQIALGTLGLIGLLCSIYFWTGLPDSVHFQSKSLSPKKTLHSFFQHLHSPSLLGIFGIAFLLMGGFVSMYNYIGYLLTNPPYSLSQTAIGWIFVVYIMGTFSSVWMGKLADQTGRLKILAISMGIMLMGGFLTIAASLSIKIIGIAIFTFGFFGSHSVASGMVGKLATANKAQASSLYLLFYYAGSSLLGSVGGLFWDGYQWAGVLSMIAICIFVAFLLEFLIIRANQHKAAGAFLHNVPKQ